MFDELSAAISEANLSYKRNIVRKQILLKERLEFLRTRNTKKILLSSSYRKGRDLDLLLIQQSRKLTP